MLEHIVSFFLAFNHNIVIIPVIVLGYIWLDRGIFYHACCLILLSMLFNYALKITFQIPLNPMLGKPGFAFPSGHMQASWVLYGYLAIKINQPLWRLLIAVLLLGIGYSLVHRGFHNYFDVLGAMFFGTTLLALYGYALAKTKQYITTITLVSAGMLLLFAYVKMQRIEPHLWLAIYALLGFSIAEKICANKITASFIAKTIASIIFFAVLYLIYMLMNTSAYFSIAASLPAYLLELKWLLIAAMIPCSLWLGKAATKHCSSCSN